MEALRETVGGDTGHELISCGVINIAVVIVALWEGGDAAAVSELLLLELETRN